MSYIKKKCYVVSGAYKDDPDYPIGAEEVICMSREEAEAEAEEMRQDDCFEDVTIEETERYFYSKEKAAFVQS